MGRIGKRTATVLLTVALVISSGGTGSEATESGDTPAHRSESGLETQK